MQWTYKCVCFYVDARARAAWSRRDLMSIRSTNFTWTVVFCPSHWKSTLASPSHSERYDVLIATYSPAGAAAVVTTIQPFRNAAAVILAAALLSLHQNENQNTARGDACMHAECAIPLNSNQHWRISNVIPIPTSKCSSCSTRPSKKREGESERASHEHGASEAWNSISLRSMLSLLAIAFLWHRINGHKI